jgi:hypothetical protein
LIGLLHGRQSRIGQHQSAPCGFEQGVTQRALQFTHLGADGLHGHVEFVCSPGDATFLGNNPKIIQMLVVKGGAHDEVFRDYESAIICFFIAIWSGKFQHQ